MSVPPLVHNGNITALLRRHHRPQGVPGKVRHRDAGSKARGRKEDPLFDRRSSCGRRGEEEGKPKEPEEEGEREEAAESPPGEDQAREGSFSLSLPRRTALPSPAIGTRLTTGLFW